MRQAKIQLSIPFESLRESIAGLDWKDKRKLFDWLEEQIAQTEEQQWEKSPKFRAEIREAREAYKTGNSITIDDYVTHRRKKRK
jgi:hypothetical protein